MSANSQFSVAIHLLCFLELRKNIRITSERLAVSIGANSAIIRKIMSKLNKAGLIKSTLGTNANIMLSIGAEQISLLDIYRAIYEGKKEELFTLHRDPNPECPIGSKIPFLLPNVFDQIQTVLEVELSRITVAQLAKQMEDPTLG